MWPAKPHGKGLPDSGVQYVRDTTGTEPRCNSTMVRHKQWVWQLLVQQRPIRQLQHSSSPTTTTSFASTTNRQSNTINPTCGNTGSSGSECPQGNDNNASSSTKMMHRGRDHDRQWCSNTRLSNMVLHQTHHFIHYNMDKVRSSGQQQMKTSQCIATNGRTCTTPTSKHWLFPSMCATWHNPSCQ